MDVTTCHTTRGTSFALAAPRETPAPTLLLLAMGAVDTLTSAPYSRVGTLLHARGWAVVSVDLPCHGDDRRTGEPPELHGWAARVAAGEDIVADFRARAADVLEHLVAVGIADPARLAAAGTSRGGFSALHVAAGYAGLRAVAAFSPVTELGALREFAALADAPLVHALALQRTVAALADRRVWLTIGDADERVGTHHAVAFARALPAAAVTLRVLPIPGHVSFSDWHNDAADWLWKEICDVAPGD